MPLLRRMGSIYQKGGKTFIDSLEIVDMSLPSGGTLSIRLNDLTPESMKDAGELFEVVDALAQQSNDTEAFIEISEPQKDLPVCSGAYEKQTLRGQLMVEKKLKTDPKHHYQSRVRPELSKAPWVLRITEHKDKSVPVFIIKERIHPDQRTDTDDLVAPRSVLREKGLLYGRHQHRCLPIIRTILGPDHRPKPDSAGAWGSTSAGGASNFAAILPLDAEAGCKLALIFKLQERIKELDRVELIARRVDRFTQRGSRVLAIAHFHLWGCGQPMGHGRDENHAGRTAQRSPH